MKSLFYPSIRAGIALVVTLAAAPATGLCDVVSDAEKAGLAALAKRDFPAANASFQQALLAARKAGNQAKIADELFYVGLSLQRSIDPKGKPDAKTVAAAAAYYEGALKLRTNSAATLNNLAQLRAMQGSTNVALDLMKRAIALPDARQATYTLNYADLLLSSGEWKEACRFYALVAWAQPDNESVHETLRQVCLKFDRDLLLNYSWEMVDHGQVLQSEKYAVNAVGKDGWSAGQKEEWLALLAVSLSRQHYEPKALFKMATGGLLKKRSGEDPIGQACRELLALHEEKEWNPKAYPWWRQHIDIHRAAPRGVWPGEAFQQLSRSLAERAGNGKDTVLKEKYLLLAATLSSEAPDPVALVQLADLYAGSDRLGDLNKMMQVYEASIFQAKGNVIQSGQIQKIYDFHSALGVIYSHMGRWGDAGKADSATFQLERAFALTEGTPGLGEVQPIPLAPRLVTLLADAYSTNNAPVKAFEVQRDSCQRMLKANDASSANQVLRHIEKQAVVEKLGAQQKLEFQGLKATVLKNDQARLGTGSKTPLTVRFSPESHAVTDVGDTHRLDPQERDALENLARTVVQADATKSASRQYSVLATAPANSNVKEISVTGKQGRVVMEKYGKTFEVPFSVDNLPAGAVNKRFVRP